jgi:hypothetical protein
MAISWLLNERGFLKPRITERIADDLIEVF